MYDTKFCTPVSKAEVTMDNDAYQTVTDPSAFVFFKAKDFYLLAWTTTPWTLPANLALAVSPKLEYGIYNVDGKKTVVATKLAEKVFGEELKPEKKIKGSELVGLSYEPLIRTIPEDEQKTGTYKVHGADFVSDEDGTGIVHIAPAYGEDDYALGTAEDVDFIDVLDENGYYLPGMNEKLHELGVRDTDENGMEIWAANKFIAKVLEEKGVVYKIEYIKHEYPFNPRSKQRIMYRAFPSWFFDIQGSKPLMIEENENINWFPEHLKHGRFEKNIEQAPDWNLSRDRFWATAMPVWKGDKGTVKVVGSYDELYELSGVRLEDYHRPWVDEIEFDIDGEHFKRIEKVLDCWFESGSMPFAQLHYPFENKEKFEKNYPADFIVEYVGQVRAWFYYVHAVNTALFGHNAYKNVITTGTLAGNDGRKMSKSLGNYTDPNELMDKFSADSLRFLLLSSPVLAGEDFALLDKDVSDVARKLSMIWNTYDFFTMYAEVDKFDSDDAIEPSKFVNPLDKWIVSRLYETRNEITEGMKEYNIPKAVEGVLPFVDDLSNWFVRRSRRRFWKATDDNDKLEAYSTLYFVLVYLSQILAPFVPFLAEELYQKMTGKESSVHLLDWPEAGKIDTEVLEEMKRTRDIITEGLALRMQKSETEDQIKVRQPLSELVYDGEKLSEYYESIIADEVNVKRVTNGSAMKLDKELTDELKAEGFARELIRFVQAGRKKAGLNVDDRIKLSVSCYVSDGYKQMVADEVLATTFNTDSSAENYAYDEIVKIEGENVTISLEKA
jgi:isoleucyl-tRNA synthetase